MYLIHLRRHFKMFNTFSKHNEELPKIEENNLTHDERRTSTTVVLQVF